MITTTTTTVREAFSAVFLNGARASAIQRIDAMYDDWASGDLPSPSTADVAWTALDCYGIADFSDYVEQVVEFLDNEEGFDDVHDLAVGTCGFIEGIVLDWIGPLEDEE